MGSFNHKGNFSNLCISRGEDIIVIVGLVRKNKDGGNLDSFAPGLSFTPLTFPIRGKYNDYGGVTDVKEDVGTAAIEKIFGVSAEKLVKIVERVGSGCFNQVRDEYATIVRPLHQWYGCSGELFDDSYELGYIMDHACVFEKLFEIGGTSFYEKNFGFTRIPIRYIETLGYKKCGSGKITKYEEKVPVEYYSKEGSEDLVYNSEYGILNLRSSEEPWKNGICSIKELHDLAGVHVPIEWKTTSYYKMRFLEECEKFDKLSSKLLKTIGARNFSIPQAEEFEYSFYDESLLRRTLGLFKYNEYYETRYLLAPFRTKQGAEHMIKENADGFSQIASLLSAMSILSLTWGVTNYHEQSAAHKEHMNFAKCVYMKAWSQYRRDLYD